MKFDWPSFKRGFLESFYSTLRLNMIASLTFLPGVYAGRGEYRLAVLMAACAALGSALGILIRLELDR